MALSAIGDPLFGFAGRRVLITGGGSGLGAAMARGFADRGAVVAVAGRTADQLELVVEEIRSRGGTAHSLVFDATSRASCENLLAGMVSISGGVDVAVINHGMGHGARAEDISESEWLSVIDTNLHGAFRCAQLCGRRMLGQEGGGSIILVGSTAGIVAFPNLLAYSTSKAAMLQMARQLAAEWGDRGVRVNSICPGYMTHMMKGTENRYSGSEVDDWVVRTTPMRRKGTPEEIVGAALYFGSSASSFVTGQVLSVDGGYTVV